MLKTARYILPFAIAALPVLAMAQGYSNLENSLDSIIHLLNSYIVPLIVAIAGVYFMWGLIKYVTNQDDEGNRTSARNMMIYGIIVLFVMISVWSLVNILVGTFNTGNNNEVRNLPELPTSR
jgi:Kef-type K+ transport system membrane component KefB